jgi:hypothetical protein
MAHGWLGTGCEIAAIRPETVEHALRESYAAYYTGNPGDSQIAAWHDELSWLVAGFRSVPETCAWGVVLEYELPGEGGRRPDVVVLTSDRLIVLEFKRGRMRAGHIDQVKAYANDLADYHSETRGIPVNPVLVYTDRPGVRGDEDGVRVVGADRLPETLRELDGFDGSQDVQKWVRGTYAPLPSLVGAAKRIFRDEPLPSIKRAESAGIPELLNSLHELAAQAEERGERHLVLVTGVPGSGKTLVGLQFVYEHGAEQDRTAVLYSGNDPLVQVLQHTLGSSIFVRRWHDFDLQVGARGRLPDHNVLVFDEAQRAWDHDRMQTRKGIDRSEPELVVDAASSLPGWSVVIGLIGEGQEIYLGEEAGLGQWADAVRAASAPIRVHVPGHLGSVFAGCDVTPDERLNLTRTLRSHRAEESAGWARAILDGDRDRAAGFAVSVDRVGYELYVTTDLLQAKRYVLDRYDAAVEKTFGLLASSKARNLRPLGVDNEYQATSRLKIGPWFADPPDSPFSCRQMTSPVTEFQCQGLELDLPVLCWGDDLGWEDGWQSRRITRAARDSHQLRLNSYRVLMTRGRDGLVVWVPPNLPRGDSQRVVETLRSAGMRAL